MGHLASTPPFSRVDTDKWNGEGQMIAIGSLRHPPKSLGVNTTPFCCSFSPTQWGRSERTMRPRPVGDSPDTTDEWSSAVLASPFKTGESVLRAQVQQLSVLS